MYIDKIIKREILTLLVSIISVAIVIIGISFALFYKEKETKSETIKIGDLKIEFCNDYNCNQKYDNMGQIIGTQKIGNIIVPSKIYPYEDKDALNKTPYIFNIKNTGDLEANIKIKLNEDKEFVKNEQIENYESTTLLYSDYLKIGISDCTRNIDEDVIISKYSSLEDNIILSGVKLKPEEEKTYCLWTWFDINTPNGAQNTYFVANIDFNAEYIPSDN